jgi:hypothetical protein
MNGMVTGPERRRAMRVDVPKRVRGGELKPHFVHLLNLSLLGVRVTHLKPWHEGVVCSVELPPALGALRLPGRVVWTRLRETERTLDGDRRSLYESGVEFARLTAEQQAALATALATLQTEQGPPHREPSACHGG